MDGEASRVGETVLMSTNVNQMLFCHMYWWVTVSQDTKGGRNLVVLESVQTFVVKLQYYKSYCIFISR